MKGEPSGKVLRRRRNDRLKRLENKHKNEVRIRDRRCRFPFCGCKRFGYALHVSHQQHKGMGGDPTGKRSARELMIYICVIRHREGKVSIDKGTLRWLPLTPAGSDSLVAWEVKQGVLPEHLQDGTGDYWVEVAREADTDLLSYEPLTERQRAILAHLSGMQL